MVSKGQGLLPWATSGMLLNINCSLVHAADGTAGGTHILLSAAVNEGQLHIFKVQILDKRWVRGADKDGKGAFKSFVVV